ncbi:metallophosphoesterase [Asticcacaulis sp. AND118]|uniref:metallophosphoesterase n=1 Tax=Asticcacaulis sp. AND118 TaxID=2840468 RepID=UPI001CFF8652|nr:metallophosphoesterase [Asticcacaulis sp. AND118]UDF02519.1 metallophosphoesterase [Asticcacaulis sp. AND118]
MKRLAAVALFLTLGVSGCALLPKPQPDHVDFVVINDTPYDDTDRAMLAKAIPAVRDRNPPFILHVGDIQSGGEVCGPPDDAFARLVSDLKPIPLFYTPGDNEWTDCDRKDDPATGRRFSELARLDILRKRFFAAPAVTDAKWRYVQQRDMPENARFDYGRFVFVTVNLTATNNARDSVMGDDVSAAARAADQRDARNIDWLKAAFAHARQRGAAAVVIATQADMITEMKPDARFKPCTDAVVDNKRLCDGFLSVRSALIADARAFGKPVFLIHGDTAPFTLTQGDLPGSGTTDKASNLWRLNTAGDAGADTDKSWGVRDVTAVSIDLRKAQPISAHGLLTGEIPGRETPGPEAD